MEMLYRQVADLARRAGVNVPAPATPDQIEAARQAAGGHLPPSYVRMLQLQNGWPRAWDGFYLLSTEGLQGRSKQLTRLRRKWWKNHGVDPDNAAACAAWKAPRGELVPWHHVVLGFSKTGELLAFDTGQVDDNGEMPVVRVHPQGGVICSWPSMEEWMLAAAIDGLEDEEADYPSDTDDTE